MPELVSSATQFFDKPTTVTVADKQFKNINSVDTKNYTDLPDTKVKSVAYLEASNSKYSVYVEDGKVVSTVKAYNEAVSKNLGGKVYKNITSYKATSDGTRVYETINPNTFLVNHIQVDADGKVTDFAKESRKMMIGKLTKPIKKLISMIKK